MELCWCSAQDAELHLAMVSMNVWQDVPGLTLLEDSASIGPNCCRSQ